ncbi:MAG TPA: OmpA family protein [Polyangiaceae bacterium]|jgi:outer membrane protein OmpA-like peptidoglycan-associated protein
MARPHGRFHWAVALAALGSLLAARPARAQQHTFHLDRLEVPGAPDDGLVLFRPVVRPDPAVFYAQLGLGFSLNPLRMNNILASAATLRASPVNVITTQLSTYLSVGFEFLDRVTLGATFPAAWVETGNQPSQTFTGSTGQTTYGTSGPSVGDTRFDARWIAFRSDDRARALGAQVNVWVPTGTSTNFGGDGGVSGMIMLTGEIATGWKLPLIFDANAGVVFRPENSVNNPGGQSAGPKQGLGIGNEVRAAVGAFLPFANDRFRLGLSIFGQTGIQSDDIIGDTVFTSQNTPLEWNGEARINKIHILGDRWFVTAGAGTRILTGYGGPDLRIVAMLGTYLPIEDTDASSPPVRIHAHVVDSEKDTDGDGIPDEIDACPTEPEDHKPPDPGDGCPALADRDGDGIPDQYDKCPDEPEDKDGIDDLDGCPEDDADNDGIPDAKDACPKEPGQPDPDPKKNGCPRFIHLEGGMVRVLQQVHFATGSATILADSFPMLMEIAQLLKANPTIQKMRIEGHTDNHGGADYNLDLSKRRAASVRTWLVQHGIDAGRLESEGYGLTRPIETNDTDEGRAANRRVEFKITEEDKGEMPQRKQPLNAD